LKLPIQSPYLIPKKPMLKVDEEYLDWIESKYLGLKEYILEIEQREFPLCPNYDSNETA